MTTAVLFILTSALHVTALRYRSIVNTPLDKVGTIRPLGTTNDFSQQDKSHSDGVTRWLHEVLPLSAQQYFRDTGGIQIAADSITVFLGALLFLGRPFFAVKYLELISKIHIEQYGPTRDHILEILQIGPVEETDCLVFVHGGAWGSGKPWMYRLAALGMAKLYGVPNVVVLGYPVFPKSTILQQRDCILAAIKALNKQSSQVIGSHKRIILTAHSSGANICALAILEAFKSKQKLADVFVGLAGVYDISSHYKWEARRGVHIISPMSAAASGPDCFDACSPTVIARSSGKALAMAPLTSEKVEHQGTVDEVACLPYTLLLHGTSDPTVPHTSSVEFGEALRDLGYENRVQTILVPCGHADPIFDLMDHESASHTTKALTSFWDSLQQSQ